MNGMRPMKSSMTHIHTKGLRHLMSWRSLIVLTLP